MIAARAFWWRSPGRGAVLEEALAEPGPGWSVVRTICSAVSPGTERLVSRGLVPAELDETMRCPYMGGRFGFPLKYGYSLVGEVAQGSPRLVGRRVHLLHPHQDLCVVRDEDLAVLPDDLPSGRAALAANLETAVNAVWDADIRMGDRALVVGFGAVGSLAARLLAFHPGVELRVADIRRRQRGLAEALGFRVHDGSPGGTFDVAFEASGEPAGLQFALDQVGFEGRVIVLSWFGTRPASLDLGRGFHSGRKSIIGSQVGAVARSRRPGWDARRRRALVLELLGRPEFDAHITRTIAFEELPSVFRGRRPADPAALSTLVLYGGGNPCMP